MGREEGKAVANSELEVLRDHWLGWASTSLRVFELSGGGVSSITNNDEISLSPLLRLQVQVWFLESDNKGRHEYGITMHNIPSLHYI